MRFTSLLLEKLPYFPDCKMHQDFRRQFMGKNHFVRLNLLSQILAEQNMVPFEFSVGHTVPLNLLSAVTRIISYLLNSYNTI